MTNITFNPTCADDESVNEYVYVCMYIYMYKLPVMLYQTHFYNHVIYHKLCFCSVWTTGVIFVEHDALDNSDWKLWIQDTKITNLLSASSRQNNVYNLWVS